MSYSAHNLRVSNRQRVIDALRRQASASRAELARALDLSKVTLSSIAGECLEQGWLVETPAPAGGVGRRPVLLALSPRLGLIAAVDIHARTVTMRLSDLRGTTLAEATTQTPADTQAFRSWFEQQLAQLCASCHRQPEALRAVVFAVPASVAADGTLRCIGQPGYLAELDLAAHVRGRFPGVAVGLVNNRNAAALAEHAEGSALDWSDFVFVGIGQSGVGAGLVLSGHLHRGAHHCAGEIGDLPTGDEGRALDSLAEDTRSATFYQRLAQWVSFMDHLLDLDGVVLHASDIERDVWAREMTSALRLYSTRPVTLRAAVLGETASLVGASRRANELAWTMIHSEMAAVGGQAV